MFLMWIINYHISILTGCFSDSDESKCMISWNGNNFAKLLSSSSCEKILVEGQCKIKCCNSDTEVLCEKNIKCTRSSGNTNAGICYQTEKSTTQQSSITRDAVSTTAPTTSTKSTTFVPFDKNHQTASQGNGDSVVIALGVVAGLAILALLVTLVLVFIFRRRKRGRKPTCTNVYMDMNVSEVGSTTYESSMGSQKHHERLENECSNTKDRQSGLYMDLDDTAIVKSDQTTQQQQSGTEATDGIYNSIDEYEPNVDEGYSQTNDLSQRSQDLASPVDFPVPSADYFVLEKQEEMSSTRPTEDLNQTGNYFVLG
ncbi:uncharacterized protein LOC110460038 [Mizuhopecten yessoensis]|uniref:uncharacterized protein LOC110460038 n=1 Tax=Mizuhopecten yessoensis TaxID=6573 RepID=UPI000B45DB68|nr:uncharacterized protein LOC110460038 [Mizuhopecten yessoensis]